MIKILLLFFIFFLFMPLQTWDGMQKNATDDETIEQAINRLIAVHEADSTSHLGVGESLQAHKNADVIDHPAWSVVPDKKAPYLSGALSFQENGMTFDKWTIQQDGIYSLVDSSNFHMGMHCKEVSPARADVLLSFSFYHVNYATDYLYLEFYGCLSFNSELDSWVCCGWGPILAYGHGFGFRYKHTDGHLYAFHRNNSTYYETDLGYFEQETYQKYRVELSGGAFLYYINNVLVATHNTNIFTGYDTAIITMGVIAGSTYGDTLEVNFIDYYLSSSPII